MTTNAEEHAVQPIRIDIVSDVVCPWCIIGYKQLERAQAETGRPAVVYWHPFELNPDMPAQGENLIEHVAAKYGMTTEASRKARARLKALGDDLGFSFDYADDMRMVNSFRAHQLLHWAATKGLQHQLKMALFGAFFTDRRNIDNPTTLIEVAGEVGLPADEAKAVLDDARFAEKVRQHELFWTSHGVQGVPAMLFSGQHVLLGAQGVDGYRAMLERVAEESVAPPAG
ncbi:MAG: DsbA family oxidoreductase [Pseudomonadota bacterium]